jgi:hypothetical protein
MFAIGRELVGLMVRERGHREVGPQAQDLGGAARIYQEAP